MFSQIYSPNRCDKQDLHQNLLIHWVSHDAFPLKISGAGQGGHFHPRLSSPCLCLGLFTVFVLWGCLEGGHTLRTVMESCHSPAESLQSRRVTGRSEWSLGATAWQSILTPGCRGWKGWTTLLQLVLVGLSITEISKHAGNPQHLRIMSHISRCHKLGFKILFFLLNK